MKIVDLHFTPEDWERVKRNWGSWLAGELSRPMVWVEGRAPGSRGTPRPNGYVAAYPLEMDADAVLDLYQADLETRRYYGDGFPKWWLNFGPGIMAGFLGGEVHAAPETDVAKRFLLHDFAGDVRKACPTGS